MRGPDFVPLPMHRDRAWAVHLHAVHANVPNAFHGVLGDHHWQGDIGSPVFRPTGNDRKPAEIDVIASPE